MAECPLPFSSSFYNSFHKESVRREERNPVSQFNITEEETAEEEEEEEVCAGTSCENQPVDLPRSSAAVFILGLKRRRNGEMVFVVRLGYPGEGCLKDLMRICQKSGTGENTSDNLAMVQAKVCSAFFDLKGYRSRCNHTPRVRT